MPQIDPTTVDVNDVIARIQAVRRGELPEDAVSIDELRAALQAQRDRFRKTAEPAASGDKPVRASAKKITIAVPQLGGEFDF